MCVYLARSQDTLQTRNTRNTACTSATQANLHDSQHCLHVNKACKIFATLPACFFARNIVNFFCNCGCVFLLLIFLQPELRGLCRMAICAGAGFLRDSELFFIPVFFYLTNMAGCCIITGLVQTKGIPKNRHMQGFLYLHFLIFYEIIRV